MKNIIGQSPVNFTNTGDDVVVRNKLNALVTVMINAPEFQLM